MPLLLSIVLTYTIPVVRVFSYQVVVLIFFVVQLITPYMSNFIELKLYCLCVRAIFVCP